MDKSTKNTAVFFLLWAIFSTSICAGESDYLLFSVEKGHIQNAKRALKTGADINSRDYFGKTPLIHAAARGDSEMVQLLLKFGAAATIMSKDRDGKTALNHARENGHKKIEAILVEYGAKD